MPIGHYSTQIIEPHQLCPYKHLQTVFSGALLSGRSLANLETTEAQRCPWHRGGSVGERPFGEARLFRVRLFASSEGLS